MSTHETFKNAPIVEALLDVEVERSASSDLAYFSDFTAAIAETFSDVSIRKEYTGNFAFDETGDIAFSPPEAIDIGYSYKNAIKDKVVQARFNGFSFSKLQPYTKWDEVFSEFIQYWHIYNDILKPGKNIRASVRYINRIIIPFPIIDINEYFNMNIKIPKSLPHMVEDLFFRARIPFPDTKIHSVITSGLELSNGENYIPGSHLGFIYDIECTKSLDIDTDIANVFGLLRDTKNTIFFNIITEKTREMFR